MLDGRAIHTPGKGDLKQQEVPSRRPWRELAACRGMDVNLFYGFDGEEAALRIRRERLVKAVCEECPVKEQCLEAAVNGGEFGVWGGLTQNQRKVRLKKMRRAERLAKTAAVDSVIKTQSVDVVETVDLCSRRGWDDSVVLIRREVFADGVDGVRWLLLKDGVIKYATSVEDDAWLMFGSWTVTF